MTSLTNKKYNIITFGCQMNEHDSEVIAGMLQNLGCLPVEDKADADIVVINTCSIRENADKRFFGTLGQLKKIKAVKPDFIACVCGCMMQQEHITTAIKQRYPWVDVIFGTHNIDEFPEMLQETLHIRDKNATFQPRTNVTENATFQPRTNVTENATFQPRTNVTYNLLKHEIRSSKESRVMRIYDDRPDIVEGLPSKRLYKHKAFVNIMYGCNNFCTYCIVPYTRGREKSRKPEDIIAEVKNLVADGVREVTLLGQNVNSYKGGDWDFTDLIYALDKIEGLERIRFMTSHPKDLSDKLIKAFVECDSLCKYIHLPVQAGSSKVLKAMNRKYDREKYLDLIRKLREAVPHITISTDIIVGFPGETEEDFEETLTLAEQVGYDSAFTFLYSPRKGTPAAEMPDQIPEEVKHERFNRLVDVINASSQAKNDAYVGRTVKVLIEGSSKTDPTVLAGRTDGFKLVDIKVEAQNPEAAREKAQAAVGNIVDVTITDAKTFSLKGRL